MIEESQLAWMRERYNKTLDRTCTLSKPSDAETRDSYGEVTTEPETAATGVPYARMSTAGTERLVGASVVALGDYLLRFGYDEVVEPEMTVTDEDDGRVFKVKRQLDRSQQIGLRVLATEG
jgi:hypothetical protein